ncbi:MAG: hypothetical protein ACREBF_03690 [Candidatus Micrarchaeales archaeon]
MGLFNKQKEPVQPFVPDVGESIKANMPDPKILVHETNLQKFIRDAGNAAANRRLSTPRMPGIGGIMMGGAIGGLGGALIGGHMGGGGTTTFKGSGQRTQQEEIKADNLILTNKRLLGVINGSQVVLEVGYDLESLNGVISGQKARNLAVQERVVFPPDRGEKYSGMLAVKMTSPNTNSEFLNKLRNGGYKEDLDVLFGIEVKKGLLGGYTFIVEVSQISFPLKVKDDLNWKDKLKSLNRAERELTFINEMEDEVDTVKYDIKLHNYKQNNWEQIMIDWANGMQQRIEDLKKEFFAIGKKDIVVLPKVKDAFGK